MPDFESLFKLSELMKFDPFSLNFDERQEHSFSAQIMWAQEVRVVGGVKADHWAESVEWEHSDQFDIQIPPLRGWKNFNIEGYVVQDESSEPYFRKESIVFCAKIDLPTYPLLDDDIVVVTRCDDRGLFETTLKEVYITASDGKTILTPVGERAEYNLPFQLVETVTENPELWMPQVTRTMLRGIVVSSYRPELAGVRRSELAKSKSE